MNQLPQVHVVTNDRIIANSEFINISTSLMQEPIALHLRGRSISGIRLQNIANLLQPIGNKISIVINDRVDVAVATGVQSVHLPEDGLPPARVKSDFGPHLTVGCSTHSSAAAARAIEGGADYVFLGPVWSTQSHPDRDSLGIKAISAVNRGRVIAIGGVTVARISSCLDAGAYGVAAISAIWDAVDPVSVVRAMCDMFRVRSN